MVVFTCNNCGDSVTKPKVVKHIQYECKRKHFAVSFCCVDCLNDFNFETVKDHCQCVTEEQRYSAKGFVPKASSEKGKRKQAGWVDIVQSVINREDLPNDERQFLNIIAKFDNVPRKKNKFQNFCFSTAPAYRKKGYLVDKVFDMIEAEFNAQKALNSNEKPTDSSNIQNKSNTDSSEKNDVVQDDSKIKKKKKSVGNNEIENANNETKETVTKEKKKGKKSLVEVNNKVETKSDDFENANNKPEETTKKEKKKGKRSLVEANNEIETKSEENVTPVSEKKKKKKGNNSVTEEKSEINNETKTVEVQSDSPKKSKSQNKPKIEETKDLTKSKENGVSVEENKILDEKSEIQISKKDKKAMKKKMKYQQELAIVSSGVVEADKEPVSKSKKRKLIANEENEEPQQKTLKIDEIPKIPEIQSGRKFIWDEAIAQVLQNKKNKPILINKVMKRVLNEYHLLNETTKKSESELEKIFLKKLKKNKNVSIKDDNLCIQL